MDNNIREHVNSFFTSESYLVDGKVLVDCGDLVPDYVGVEAVLLTHAHFDHIYGLNELLSNNPELKVYTNEEGKTMLLDSKKNLSKYHDKPFVFMFQDQIVIVNDGDIVDVCGLKAKAVYTPGHSPSCITWIIGDALFTGDSYIPGIKTVTNLPGANKQHTLRSEILIKTLMQRRRVYPGHKL